MRPAIATIKIDLKITQPRGIAMPSPFPGMNPYLENPDLWSEVHHRLITAIAIALSSNLSLRYRVAIKKRTYLNDGEESVSVAIPDVSVYSQSSTPVQT